MTRFWAIFFFVASSIPLQAQNNIDKDYQKFRKSFLDDIQSYNQNKNEKNLPVFYVKLPAWFCQSRLDGSGMKTLGISNPGLDSVSAFNQALVRAKALAAMFQLRTIHCMTHSFNEYYPSVGTNFFRFISLNSLDASFPEIHNYRILNSALLASGEVVLEVSFPQEANKPKPTTSKISVHIDYYTELRRKNKSEDIQSKINWQLKQKPGGRITSDNFDLYGIPPFYYWDSDNENYHQTSDSLKFSLYYIVEDSSSNNETDGQSFSLKRGLWSAYLNAVIHRLVISAYNQHWDTDIKSVSDFYSQKDCSFTQSLNDGTINPEESIVNVVNNHLSIKTVEP